MHFKLTDEQELIQATAREFAQSDAIKQFGNRGVMDLAGLIGYYSFVNITLKSFDVQLAPGRTRLLPPLW